MNSINIDGNESSNGITVNTLLPEKVKDQHVQRKGKARALIAIAIFIISYLSFSGNALGVASPEWFRIHQIDSEQYTLDGILYQKNAENSQYFGLGVFSRPGIKDKEAKHALLYNQNNTEGEFVPYNSQFGLQAKIFSQAQKFGLSFNSMQNLTAALLALLCSLSYLILRELDFPGLPSLVFAASFAFSPWVVVFARNLYWVTFTMYLPVITGTAICAGRKNTKSNKIIVLAIGLYVAFLLKMLCGYEYITTIFVSTIVCSLVAIHRRGGTIKDLARLSLVISISFAIAFGSAAGIHIDQLNRRGLDGVKAFVLAGSKRASSGDPSGMFSQLCVGARNPSSCVQDHVGLSKSLQSNPIKVVGRYLAVKDSLPWSYLFSSSRIAGEVKAIKDARGKIDMLAILSKSNYGEVFAFLADSILKLLNSSLLIGLGLYCLASSRNKLQTAAVIFLLFLGPISWFVLAKGHSAIHYGMNYITWYIVLFPSMALIAAGNFTAKASLSRKQVHTQSDGNASEHFSF